MSLTATVEIVRGSEEAMKTNLAYLSVRGKNVGYTITFTDGRKREIRVRTTYRGPTEEFGDLKFDVVGYPDRLGGTVGRVGVLDPGQPFVRSATLPAKGEKRPVTARLTITATGRHNT